VKIIIRLEKTFVIDTMKADHTDLGETILKHYNEGWIGEAAPIESLDEADPATLHDVVRDLIDLQEIDGNDFQITIGNAQTVEP
jgi:hypothetical protein